MLTALPSLTNLDDKTLIRFCLDGKSGAFDTLMKRYLKSVYSYVFHYVQDAEMADDLTQETFIRVYRFLHQFDTNRSFKSWLLTIATNVSKTALRKNQSQALLLNDEAIDMNVLENQEDPHTVDKDGLDTTQCTMVQQALAQLSPSIRQAMILRHVHDLPYEEIASTMEANINTVRTWLKRGRESLRTLITEQNGGFDHD